MLELAGEDVHSCPSGVARDEWFREEDGDESQLEDSHQKLETVV